MHARDPGRPAGEQLGREVAQRRDHAGLDQLDLPPQVALAGLDLVGQGIPIARRSAHDDIGDVHLVAREADTREQLLQQLPRGSDERDALLVLVEPRRLADEHQIRGRRARAEHDLRARPRQRAALAPGDHVAVGDQ